MPRRRVWFYTFACMVLLLVAACRAHPAFGTVALVKVEPDGRVTVIVVHDALAFALGETSARIADEPMYDLLRGPDADLAAAFEDGRVRFTTHFRLFADGVQTPIELRAWPNVDAIRDWQRERSAARLPCKLDFVAVATLPPGTRAISIRLPEVFGEAIISVDRPREEPFAIPVGAGEALPPLPIELDAEKSVSTTAAAGTIGGGDRAADSGEHPRAAEPLPATIGALSVAMRYIRLGFTHIIPHGTDHALFVLGLFLLSPRVKSLLWQITAFTIAHTVTLTLTTLGLVNVTAGLVEPVIAGTIAFVAIENVLTAKSHPWRPVVAFVFGLVHGLGFASALSEVGLPTGQLAAGLASFSVGVECGHLVVLAAAFALLGPWRQRTWYRKRVAMPISLCIGAVAVFWMVQRVVQPG